jgi:hypothetical protein
MASKKISELTNATTPTRTDLHVLARGTTNRNITTADLFQESMTLTEFETKRVANGLIAGRWYRVTECGSGSDRAVRVLAIENNQYSRQVVLENLTTGPTWCDWFDLTVNPAMVTDANGNRYERYYDGGVFPPLNVLPGWSGNFVDGSEGNITFTGADNCYVNACEFLWGSYNVYASSIQHSRFENSTLYNVNESPLNMNRVDVNYSTINNSAENVVTLNQVYLLNTILNLEGGSEITLANSRFENVTVHLRNGANVNGLTIFGKKTDLDESIVYIIDGNYQDQVYDQWAGMVIADRYAGTSTVRAYTRKNDTEAPLTYDPTSKRLFLPTQSPIGEVLLFTDTTALCSVENILLPNEQLWHEIRLNKLEGSAGSFELTFTTEVDASYSTQVIVYHGAGAKLGQLYSPTDFAVIKSFYSGVLGAPAWFIVDGQHYD